MTPETPEYLTTAQVAKLLQLSEQKLKMDRKKGIGLPYVELKSSQRRTIRYIRADIQRYLELATVIPRGK